MQHTFLLTEGVWEARGTFFGESGAGIPVEGQTRISHSDKIWRMTGDMRLPTDPPVEIRNDYTITPFRTGSDTTGWVSENPALGTLRGWFSIVADSIISTYVSEDGTYSGAEYLQQIAEDRYLNRGVLYGNAGRESSWAVELRKIRQ